MTKMLSEEPPQAMVVYVDDAAPKDLADKLRSALPAGRILVVEGRRTGATLAKALQRLSVQLVIQASARYAQADQQVVALGSGGHRPRKAWQSCYGPQQRR